MSWALKLRSDSWIIPMGINNTAGFRLPSKSNIWSYITFQCTLITCIYCVICLLIIVRVLALNPKCCCHWATYSKYECDAVGDNYSQIECLDAHKSLLWVIWVKASSKEWKLLTQLRDYMPGKSVLKWSKFCFVFSNNLVRYF